MNKNLYNGNRKIKSEIYSNPLSIYIDPLTLELRTKEKEAKEYITQFSFDKNMNLYGYSDPFTFENCLVEYCIGMIVNKFTHNFIITYSTLDKTTNLIVLPNEYIKNMLTRV